MEKIRSRRRRKTVNEQENLLCRNSSSGISRVVCGMQTVGTFTHANRDGRGNTKAHTEPHAFGLCIDYASSITIRYDDCFGIIGGQPITVRDLIATYRTVLKGGFHRLFFSHVL